MKLVLIIPNFDTYTITPQLGVLYISSFLKKHGHNVVIIDALKDNLTPNQILKITKKENPDAIGVHCLSSFYKEASQIIKLLKIDNYIVFVGGVHPTFAPYTTLKETGADFVVIGEGELPILELANNNFKNNIIFIII